MVQGRLAWYWPVPHADPGLPSCQAAAVAHQRTEKWEARRASICPASFCTPAYRAARRAGRGRVWCWGLGWRGGAQCPGFPGSGSAGMGDPGGAHLTSASAHQRQPLHRPPTCHHVPQLLPQALRRVHKHAALLALHVAPHVAPHAVKLRRRESFRLCPSPANVAPCANRLTTTSTPPPTHHRNSHSVRAHGGASRTRLPCAHHPTTTSATHHTITTAPTADSCHPPCRPPSPRCTAGTPRSCAPSPAGAAEIAQSGGG